MKLTLLQIEALQCTQTVFLSKRVQLKLAERPWTVKVPWQLCTQILLRSVLVLQAVETNAEGC